MASKKRKTAPVQNWPAEKIEQRPIGELLAYPQNPMIHSDEQVQKIANSITEYGWTIPVLVDETGVLIAGHARIRAAQSLGITEVPTMVARGWSAEQKKSYRIFDNQAPRLAEFNTELLRIELNDLKLADYPLELTGFDNLQLVEFMAGVPTGKDPEATPEPPSTPVSKRGDIWVLGQHRLMCGDATSAEDVERLLDGSKPHLMVTDPPWGVEYDATHRRALQSVNSKPAQGAVTNDDRADWGEAWALFGGEVAYVWHSGTRSVEVAASLESSRFEMRAQIIWAKAKFVIGRGHYHVQHEPCWYAVRGTGHWSGDRTQSTLWEIEHRKSETGHSTQKPIECMKRPIENNSQPGDTVYDPFLGSGTTLVAAEITGRKCLGLEIDAGYCDVIVQRWQDLTTKEAHHAVSGLTYEEERDARAKPARKRKRVPAAA